MVLHVALVPVKPTAFAKSRLVGLGHDVRRELATAFARDVLAATTESDVFTATVLVTDDEGLREGWDGPVARDTGSLNGSLLAAADIARETWPDAVPVAVCADLPCLTPRTLSALAGVSGPAFVPDHSGDGTSVYVAPYAEFAPQFGVDSARAHESSGACRLEVPSALRRDVDTLTDLAEAVALGVGAHTSRALAAHRFSEMAWS